MTLAGFAAALGIAVPVAMASDVFSDVPTGSLFHNQISAIARAGITTGCGPNIYCPDQNVTRRAMAAFMHRGFSRVAESNFNGVAVNQTAEGPLATIDTLTITPGLPTDGVVAGANGFIEVNVSLALNAPSSLCPCEYRIAVWDDTESEFVNSIYSWLYVFNNEVKMASLTAVVQADVIASHTLQLRVHRFSGTGTGATAFGNFTASYHPFGSAGTDVLSTEGSAPSGKYATPGN